jgi:hypothetical protein
VNAAIVDSTLNENANQFHVHDQWLVSWNGSRFLAAGRGLQRLEVASSLSEMRLAPACVLEMGLPLPESCDIVGYHFQASDLEALTFEDLPMASQLRSRARRVAALSVLLSLGAGCGAHAAGDAKAPTEAPAAAAEAGPPAASAPAPAPPPAEPAVAAPLPSEILSVPDKAWVFSFESSAGYGKAKTSCDERFKDDPRGRARCIGKARDAFTADAMEFTRDAAGNDVWVIYRNKSNRLVQVYSVQIEYGTQAADTVNIKKLGKEKGTPVLFSGVSEFKVKLGGEYSLELEDAQHGLLAYDARLGFISGK